MRILDTFGVWINSFELKNRCLGRHCLQEVVTEQQIQKKEV